MKCETAESDSEINGNARTASDETSAVEQNRADASSLRNNHDIRASMVIINGYSQALSASFRELENQYNMILDQQDGLSDTANADRLMTLEADCRFCLSRLCSSIAQFKKGLAIGGVLSDSPRD